VWVGRGLKPKHAPHGSRFLGLVFRFSGQAPASLISKQAIEGSRVGVVVLPVAEVRNEVRADFACRIFSGVGIEAFPVADNLERNKAYRKQDPCSIADLAFAGLRDFCFDPFATHAVLRQNQ
jgi:hypothetical protein